VLTTIDASEIALPDADGLVHLQLRRFAGCPVCNLHLRSFTSRIAEIERTGIREVVVFHSSDAELHKYQGDMPFDVVGDPNRLLYKEFGVETSPRAVLNPRAWKALPRGWWNMIRRAIRYRRAPLPIKPTGGSLGLPADFLIAPDGRLVAVKYGSHAYDQWSVDEVLSLAADRAA
jgi:hypothetical protein